MPKIFVVIPAYNEEDRIEPALREYAEYSEEHFKGEAEVFDYPGNYVETGRGETLANRLVESGRLRPMVVKSQTGRDIRTLLPLDQLWRTGANNATEFHTSRALRFGDLSLDPGAYSLFTIPRADGWTLIINRQIGMSGLARDPAQDLGQIEMEVRNTPFMDRFTILVEQSGAGGVLRPRFQQVQFAGDGLGAHKPWVEPEVLCVKGDP